MNDPSWSVVDRLRTIISNPKLEGLRDSELLRIFAETGQGDAFASLLRRHGPMVLGLARRIVRDHHIAEDVCQATFLILSRKARAIQGRDSLPAWLHHVALRLAIRSSKSRRRSEAAERDAFMARGRDPLDDLTAREFLTIVDEEVNNLPEKYRLPLILCQLEGFSREEAARRLNWSLAAVKARLEEGRERLRLRLSRRGLASAAAAASSLQLGREVLALPPALMQATVRAAVTGKVASAGVVALANSAVTLTFVTKLQKACLTVALLGMIGWGVERLSQAGGGEQVDGPAPGANAWATVLQENMKTSGKKKTNVDEKSVRALVSQLGDESFKKREEAEAKLIALGRPAVSLVTKAAAQSVDAEVLQRTARVLKAIRALPGPSVWFPDANVFDIAFSKDGQSIAVGGADGAIRIFDGKTGTQRQTLKGHTGTVYSLVFSSDAKTLVSCGGGWWSEFNQSLMPGEIIIWDLAKATAVGKIEGPVGSVVSVALAPDEKKLYSTGGDGKIRMWDIATRKELKVGSGHNAPVRRVIFSPDGKLLASAGMDATVRFWDPDTLEETRQIVAHPNGVGTLAFSPDGKYLITVNRANSPPIPGDIKVWDMTTYMEKTRFQGHKGKVLSLAVSPDNKLLAVGGGSNQEFGEIVLFDLATGAKRASFDDHKEWVECVTFSADGNWLVSGGGYTPRARGEVRVWDAKRLVAKGE